MKDQLIHIRVEAPIGYLYRENISGVIKRSFDVSVEYYSDDEKLEQHLDAPTSLQIASITLAIVNLLLNLIDKFKSNRWSLEKLKDKVCRSAAESLGTDNISILRIDGLKDFLDKQHNACRVVAEVRDEIYSFIVFRQGKIIVIKYDPNSLDHDNNTTQLLGSS